MSRISPRLHATIFAEISTSFDTTPSGIDLPITASLAIAAFTLIDIVPYWPKNNTPYYRILHITASRRFLDSFLRSLQIFFATCRLTLRRHFQSDSRADAAAD